MPRLLNIPTILTLLRIILIPIFISVFYLGGLYGHIVASLLFLCAALTDWLDGYLARNLAQSTKFGAFLDPVADKLLVICALVMVVGEMHSRWLVIPAAIIVAREVAMSALREWAAHSGHTEQVRVNTMGKIKTIVQMLALLLLIIYQPWYSHNILYLGILFLYISMILSVHSMVLYMKEIWSDLTLVK